MSRLTGETIFKHGLSLVDDIDFICVFDKKEKEAVIDAYAQFGITHLPDGRSVVDMVVVGKGKPKRAE